MKLNSQVTNYDLTYFQDFPSSATTLHFEFYHELSEEKSTTKKVTL